jgi:predicted DsbA family dithiol-disulfide isomerase
MLLLPLAAPPAAAQGTATPVDLELVLAIDASYSIDNAEFRLQMEGIAAAFRDPEIQAAIGSGPLGAIAVSPNTLDAHRLIRWAQTVGAEAQTRLVGLLFKAYFEDGKDIGERTVLIEAATEAGMDAALAETLLATDADRDAVRSEIETAQRMGIRGVPCFLIENKYAVMGAQDPATLADAIRQVAAMKARGELETAS